MKEEMLEFYNERKTPLDMLMIHCTPTDMAETIKCLQDRELSAHYLIDFDGSIVKCVNEDKRAWHAGVGFWRGIDTDLNSHSIGIEMCNLSGGQEPYPQEQIDALITLCKSIIKEHNIEPKMVVGHSDIAPIRKYDPGMSFPWQVLAENGIGLWYDINDAAKIDDNISVEKMLSTIGYETVDMAATQCAFCRRFLPELVEVEPDVWGVLIDNPYKKDFNVLDNKKFINTLKAVYFAYENN